jgi:signal peptidase II
MNRRLLAFLIAAAIVCLDQLTKYLVTSSVTPGSPVEVFSFFHLVNVKNTGAAFGMLKGLGNNFFIAVSALALVLIVILILKGIDGILGFSLILGGAAGNLIDRLAYGHVRDFIDLFAGDYHWPAFNIADSALTVGILLLAVTGMRKR